MILQVCVHKAFYIIRGIGGGYFVKPVVFGTLHHPLKEKKNLNLRLHCLLSGDPVLLAV